MRRKDLREMSQRLEEVRGEWLWVKCHMGSLHTDAGALQEIARNESRAA